MKRLLKAFLFFTTLFLFADSHSEIGHTRFGFPLNTQNNEYSPIISPNGRYIVFQSNRPEGKGGMDLWVSENKNYRDRTGKAEWTEPVNLDELNTTSFEGPFSILFGSDGKTSELYFTSMKSSASGRLGYEGLNIYHTKKNIDTGRWSEPKHLDEINSMFDDKMPTISQDGDFLIFSSNRPGGFGGFDLWISYRDLKEIKWSKPVNLGPNVNSMSDEIMPSLHYDSMTLYFSSDRGEETHKFSFYSADTEDSIIVEKDEQILQKPENSPREIKFRESKKLHPPFNLLSEKEIRKFGLPVKPEFIAPSPSKPDNEGITLTQDGLWIYYSSNRLGGEGQFDIYRARVPEEMRKPYIFTLSGLVLDGSEQPMIGIDSTIKIYNEKGLVKMITSKRIGGDLTGLNEDKKEFSNFETRIYTGHLYKMEVSSPGFYPTEISLDLRGSVGPKKSKYMKIILMPLKEDTAPEEKPEKEPTPPEEKKEIKKLEGLQIVLKDYKTKEIIQTGTVTLFMETERSGIILPKEKENFLLSKIPDVDFELHAKAKDYKDETIFFQKEDQTLKDKKIIEIFLRKLKDFESVYQPSLYFDFNEFKIKAEHEKVLKKIIDYMKVNKLDLIEIGGHTDNIASKEFNTKLSQKRADEVKAYLVKQGVEDNRITTKGYWYSKPQADNSTEEGRAKNRRVDFKKLN